MRYEFNTENYDSPELLEQDELYRDMNTFDDLEQEIRKARALYKLEMTQK